MGLRLFKWPGSNGRAQCPECGRPIRNGELYCGNCSQIPVIDEVFILYDDGRMIYHMSRTLNPDMDKDKDITSSMLVALQSFVNGQMAHEIGTLQEMKFGERKVMVTQGHSLVIAVILERGETESMKDRMTLALDQIGQDYEDVLEGWDGDKEKLDGMITEMKKALLK